MSASPTCWCSGWIPPETSCSKTTNCEVVNADGKRCDKKTCKTDAESNCEYFASRCLATGHNYTGTAEAGTCTRASPDN